jgi:hypothetical protein
MKHLHQFGYRYRLRKTGDHSGWEMLTGQRIRPRAAQCKAHPRTEIGKRDRQFDAIPIRQADIQQGEVEPARRDNGSGLAAAARCKHAQTPVAELPRQHLAQPCIVLHE